MNMSDQPSGHGIVSACLRRTCRALVAATMILPLGLSGPLAAQSLTWDANGTGANQTDGGGTWNTSNQNWWNGSANTTWDNSGNTVAVFGNGGSPGLDAASATITVSGTVNAAGLSFAPLDLSNASTRAYILSGGTIALKDGALISLVNSSSNTGNARITINSALSGNNINIVKNGTETGLLHVGGANTWTGTLTLQSVGGSGGLFFNVTNVAAINSLNRINVESGNSVIIAYGQTSTLNTDFWIAGNGNSGRGAIRFDQSRTLSGDITLTANAGVSANTTNSPTGTLAGNIGEQGGSRTLSINTVSNTTGTIVLSGNNTFTGGILMNRGTLRIGSTGALNSENPKLITFATNTEAKTITLDGFSVAVGGLSAAANTGIITVQNASATAATLTLQNNADQTFFGSIVNGTGGGALSLVKQGTGTQTLARASTYTGSTTVNQGTLALDFSASGAPATNMLSSSTALVMGGGTLSLIGGSSAANSQTVNGLTVAPGASTLSLVTNATPQNLALNLGAITVQSGGSLNFVLPQGAPGAANGFTTTSLNDSTGILGGWATVNGTDWAAVQGGNIVAYTGYQDITNFGSGAGSVGPLPNNSNANVRIVDGGASSSIALAVAGTNDIHTLIQAAAGSAIIGSNSGDILRLGVSGGILQAAGAGDLTIGTAANNGSVLTAGGPGSGTPGQLLFLSQSGTQTTTVNSHIHNNGSGGTVSVVKSGPGLLVLNSNASDYSGGTFLNGGILRAMSDRSLGAVPASAQPANLTFNGGTLQWGSTFTLSSNRGITLLAGGGTLDLQTNSTTYAGKITGVGGLTKLGNGTLTLSGANDYAGQTNLSAGILVVNHNQALGSSAGATSVAATGILRLNAGITVTGEKLIINGPGNNQGNLQVQGGAATWAGDIVINASNARIGTGADGVLTVSGVISDGAASELGISAQGGMVILSGANTYSGPTTMIRGVLRLGADNTLPSNTILSLLTNVVVTETVAVDLYGSDQTISALRVGVVSNVDNLDVTNSQSGAASVLTLNQNTNTTYSGRISGNLELVKDGTGTLTLTNTYNTAAPTATTNTYTGKTTIRGGTLALSGTGNLEGTPWIQVDSGATFSISGRTGGSYTLNSQVLTGTGSVNGTLIVSGSSHIAPGSSSGTLAAAGDGLGQLSFNNLTLSGSGLPTLRMALQLGGTPSNAAGGNPADFANASSGGQYDSVNVSGALGLNAGSTIRIDLDAGYTPQLGDVFNLFDWGSINPDADGAGGAGAWTVADLDLAAANAMLGNGWYFETDLFLQHGILYIAVPEPSRMLLLVMGMLTVFGRRRRR